MRFLLIILCLSGQQGVARHQSVSGNNEYMGNVKLNGRAALKQLYQQINTNRARYFKKGHQVYNDHGVRFTMEDNGLLVAHVEMNNNTPVFLQAKLKLSNATKIKDVEKYFPKSMTQNTLHGTDMARRMIIAIRESSISKNNYILYFYVKTRRLYRVEYPE